LLVVENNFSDNVVVNAQMNHLALVKMVELLHQHQVEVVAVIQQRS